MKKIIVFILLFLLNGCFLENNYQNMNSVNTPLPTPTPTNSPTPSILPTSSPSSDTAILSSPTPTPSIPKGEPVEYTTSIEEGSRIDKILGFHPTTLKIEEIDQTLYLGWICEYEVPGMTNDDYSYNYLKDNWGNYYLYYGKLSKITDNVFSSEGDYPPSWDKYECHVNESTDFYVIFDEYKIYLVFENLSIDELRSYSTGTFSELNSKYFR